jgi:quercetin dioxygenase-like cupin family protein
MLPTTLRGLAMSLVATALVGLSAPALAGECPEGMSGANSLANAPTMPKNVTDELIGSVDLAKEIGVADRDLRMRKLVMQPGGIVPLHSHAGRPALILTVTGEVTEYRDSCRVGIVHRAGDISRESDGLSHYWVNTGTVPAVLYSADVKKRD